MIELGHFRLDLISDGLFEISADDVGGEGAARVLESRLPMRRHSRIKVGFNGLLIRSPEHTIVVDPGTGNKPREDKRQAYRLEWPRKFVASLREHGVSPTDVDTVILTHLHWDHCGGATEVDDRGKIVPVFTRARHYVQRREYEFAAASTDRDDYEPEDFQPLIAAGQLELVDGDREILDGISVEWVGGHCPGLQIVRIRHDSRQVIFLSDLSPTASHLSPDIVQSYDRNVAELKEARARVISAAVTHQDLLLFVHARNTRAGYAERREDGSLQLKTVTA